MKKLLALLLAFCIIFAFAACDENEGGDDPIIDDPQLTSDQLKAIEPGYDGDAPKLIDSMAGEVTLNHVDTESYKNAEELLSLAYAALNENDIDETITALWKAPFGLAGNLNDYDPIMIETDGDNSRTVFAVILTTYGSPDQLTLLGTFRATVDPNYMLTAIEIRDGYISNLKKELGLEGKDNVRFNFNIGRIEGFDFSPVTQAHKDLYSNTMTVYDKFVLSNWYDEQGGSSDYYDIYYKIMDDSIKSLDDLKAYLNTAFMTHISDQIYDRCMVDEDTPFYIEHEGKVYAACMGHGGPEGLVGIEPIMTCEEEDLILMIVEETYWLDFDYEIWEGTIKGYNEYLFVYEKDDQGSWKCGNFTDIPFGYYVSEPF